MLLDCFFHSKKSRTTAMFLLSSGLLVLSCGIGWQYAFAPLFHLSAGPNDFFHGFCYGLGLTLETSAVVMLLRINATRLKA